MTNGEKWRLERCKRCGEIYDICPHFNAMALIDDEHAARIRARYALGKRFNTDDHDTEDYYTETINEPT